MYKRCKSQSKDVPNNISNKPLSFNIHFIRLYTRKPISSCYQHRIKCSHTDNKYVDRPMTHR